MNDSSPQPPSAPALKLARPSYIFFGALAALSLVADVLSKAWAEVTLSKRLLTDPGIVLIKNHLTLTLAYNKGGAWGLLQTASETVRRPFFLVVSVLAIGFIISVYSRLGPGQRALKWGLPLVLGGALGNLSDRIIRTSVVDFVDYRAHWVDSMNAGIAHMIDAINKLIGPRLPPWSVTDHWPTFNVADVCICVGVGLMAVDMLTSRRKPPAHGEPLHTELSEPLTSGTAGESLASGTTGDPPAVG
jgi:signal peptidase II